MFGLVSKKRFLEVQRSNRGLKLIVNDLSEKLDRVERRSDSLEGSLQKVNRENRELTSRAIKDNTELFYAAREIARLENKVFKNSKDGIIQEVRKHLLKELTEFKKDAVKEKFDCIGLDGVEYPMEVAKEKGYNYLQYQLMENIVSGLIEDMEEKLKEVAARE